MAIFQKIYDKLGIKYKPTVDPALAKKLKEKNISTLDGSIPTAQTVKSATAFFKANPKIQQQVEAQKKVVPYEKLPTKIDTAQRLAKKTGAAIISGAAKSADFLVDTVQQVSESLERRIKYPTPTEFINKQFAQAGKPQEVTPRAKRWMATRDKIKDAIGMGNRNADLLDKFDSFTDRIMTDPSLAAPEDFNKSLKEKGVRRTLRERPLETLLEVGPSVIASAIPFVVQGAAKRSPWFAPIYFASMTANDLKQDAMEHGVSEKTATLGAIPVAAAIGAMDRLFGIGKLAAGEKSALLRAMEKDTFNILFNHAKRLATKAQRIVAGSVEEGLTEKLQEKLQIAYERAYKDVTKDEARVREGMAALGGALGGGFFGFMGNMVEETAKRVAEEPDAQDIQVFVTPETEPAFKAAKSVQLPKTSPASILEATEAIGQAAATQVEAQKGPAPKVPAEVRSNMAQFIDYVRLKKKQNLNLEEDAAKIAEDFEIPMPKTLGGLANEFEKVLQKYDEGREVLQPAFQAKEIPTELQALAEEAKKYESAEEFVREIDTAGEKTNFVGSAGIQTKTGEPIVIKAFHGTDKKFDNFVIPKEGVRYTGDGVYFYPNKESADAFVSGKKGGRTIESYLALKNPYNLYLPEGNIDFQPGGERIREIINKGHDGIVVRIRDTDTETGRISSDLINEIVVFDTNAIKTKSQLTELYNQATQKLTFKSTVEQARSALVPQSAGERRLKEYKDRLGLQFDTKLVDSILTGRIDDGKKEEAWAVTFDNTIALSEWVTKWTPDHEVVHYVWKNFENIPVLQGIDQQKILTEITEKYGKLEGMDFEETLAEEFELYMEDRLLQQKGYKTKHSFTSEAKKFFTKLWNNLLQFFKGGPGEINKFFQTLESGQATETQTRARRGRTAFQEKDGSLVFQEPQAAKVIKKPPVDAREFVRAERTRREKLDTFLEVEEGAALETQIAKNKEERAEISRAIILGIKRNPYYRKEQSLQDIMGQGWLMTRERNGRIEYLISTNSNEHARFGWQRLLEVDSLAQEAGFDNGFAYLEDQLRRSEISATSDPRKLAEKELLRTDKEYQKAVDTIEQMREYLKTRKTRPETSVRLEAKIEEVKKRTETLGAVRDFFGLTDTELKRITRKDPRFMGEKEFNEFLADVERRAEEYSNRRQAIIELEALIKTQDLKKTEQVQAYLGYPNVRDMTTDQINEFYNFLAQYQTNDVFLTERQLETVENTDLKEAKTEREVMDILVKKTGLPEAELREFRPEMLDSILWDSALAEKNGFYKLMVDTVNTRVAAEMFKYQDVKDDIFRLSKEARQSRKKIEGSKVSQLLAPTDKLVFAWLDSSQEQKVELAKEMTDEEMTYALYLQNMFANFRDDLIENEVLKEYRQNYILHTRKSFMETVTSQGLRAAATSLFEQQKKEEANFNILNEDTGEILAREKFFASALRRTGEIDPTQNVAKAAMQYAKTFYRKKAIDSFVGELDTYVKVLTPQRLTPKGLEMDRELLKFSNKWLNTKKGRVADVAFVKQGNRADVTLRALNQAVTLVDLGLNPFVQIASFAGEKSSNWVMMGTVAYARGAGRALTKKGRTVGKKYEDFVGETFWKQMQNPANDAGDVMNQVLYGGFDAATRSANLRFLLGMMTQEEYESDTISPERLAELRRLMGRYRVVQGSESVYGATSPGKGFKKYLTWALPMLRTTATNAKTLLKNLKEGEKVLGTREAQELSRVVIIGALAGMLAYGGFTEEDEDETALQKLRRYLVRDGLSVIGALDPGLFSRPPRMIQFVSDIISSVDGMISVESGKRKEGLKKIKKTITPRLIKTVFPEEKEKKKTTFEFSKSKVDNPLIKKRKAALDKRKALLEKRKASLKKRQLR